MSRHSSDVSTSAIAVATRLSQPKRQSGRYIATIQPPVYRASTIIFKDCHALNERHWSDDFDYSYGTHGTPTTYGLAEQIAALEGAQYCLLAPSGLSAIHLVNSTWLNQGDEVWLPCNAYGPNLENLLYSQRKMGVNVRIYNPLDLETVQFNARSRLIWLEAAGSVTLEFPDLTHLIQRAQAHQVITALDNTWGAGIAFSPFEIGLEKLAVDISVHALTKYPSGGGDILMGSICTQDREKHLHMLQTHATQGIAISGDDAAQISRSLAHITLRYRQHHQQTLEICHFLQTCHQFSQVLHPSLENHAGHQAWRSVCASGLAAGLVSVVLHSRYDQKAVQQFCDALQLFHLGFSWGGPTSLVMYYHLNDLRQQANTISMSSHLKGEWIIRFCVGLENTADLIADIKQALDALAS